MTIRRALDPDEVSYCETAGWAAYYDRELANRRKADRADDDLAPLADALARLHAAVFGSTPERMRVSAALRALAAARVDRITGAYSDDVAADWAAIYRLLRDAYRAVEVAL